MTKLYSSSGAHSTLRHDLIYEIPYEDPIETTITYWNDILNMFKDVFIKGGHP